MEICTVGFMPGSLWCFLFYFSAAIINLLLLVRNRGCIVRFCFAYHCFRSAVIYIVKFVIWKFGVVDFFFLFLYHGAFFSAVLQFISLLFPCGPCGVVVSSSFSFSFSFAPLDDS